MRLTLVLAVAVAACTSTGDLPPDTTQPPALIQASTADTSPPISPAIVTEQTCERIEVALSAMQDDLNAAMAGLETLDEEAMFDAEGLAVFVGPVVTFYEALGEIAEQAPSCVERMAIDGPESLGDDPYLDSLWADCDSGDGFTCDALASSAPVGSDYERFGATCTGRYEDLGPRSCAEPDERFGYGDDPDLDSLWERCSAGDSSSCNELWFASPIGSAYEAMGDACGALIDRGRDCALPAQLLGGPVG